MKRRQLLALTALVCAVPAVAHAQTIIYTPIVLTGQPLPDPLVGEFKSFPYHSVINDANQIAFLGGTQYSWAADGVFLADGTTVTHVAHAGQPAPGFPDGVTIQSFDVNYHRANNKGHATFESTLAGPGIDDTGDDNSNAFANWFWDGSELHPIAQFETPAPGTDALFRTFDRTTLNDLGHVAFRGDLIGASVNGGNDTAFWYGPPDDVQAPRAKATRPPAGSLTATCRASTIRTSRAMVRSPSCPTLPAAAARSSPAPPTS